MLFNVGSLKLLKKKIQERKEGVTDTCRSGKQDWTTDEENTWLGRGGTLIRIVDDFYNQPYTWTLNFLYKHVEISAVLAFFSQNAEQCDLRTSHGSESLRFTIQVS